MTASNANAAISKILKHEGGYVNHPSDPGGATNKGITLETFRRYIKPGGTIADLKALTTEQAVFVYKKQYWDRVSADDLPSGVDYTVADFAVNSGPHRSAVMLQRVLGVPEDGKIGPKTIAAARARPSADTINQICDARLEFMKSIRNGALWKVFKNGWSQRVAEVRETSIQWSRAPVRTLDPVQVQKQPSAIAQFFMALVALLRR